MRPLVTIIIPTLNEESALPCTLNHLQSIAGNFEVLVADGGSTDQTLSICASRPDVEVIRCPERGRALQMNFAASHAAGSLLFFLHADSKPPATLYEDMIKTLGDSRVVGGCYAIRFDSTHWMLRLISWVTTFDIPFLICGDHGLFMRKNDFEKISGFPEIPLMEDIEIHHKLRKYGMFVKLPKAMTTSARRFLNNGVIRQSLRDLYLLTAYYLKLSSPDRLKRHYADTRAKAR